MSHEFNPEDDLTRYKFTIGEYSMNDAPVRTDLTNWITQTESAIVQMQKQLNEIQERQIAFEDGVNYIRAFQAEYTPISIQNLIKRVDGLAQEFDNKKCELQTQIEQANDCLRKVETFNTRMDWINSQYDWAVKRINWVREELTNIKGEIMKEIYNKFIKKERGHFDD